MGIRRLGQQESSVGARPYLNPISRTTRHVVATKSWYASQKVATLSDRADDIYLDIDSSDASYEGCIGLDTLDRNRTSAVPLLRDLSRLVLSCTMKNPYICTNSNGSRFESDF